MPAHRMKVGYAIFANSRQKSVSIATSLERSWKGRIDHGSCPPVFVPILEIWWRSVQCILRELVSKRTVKNKVTSTEHIAAVVRFSLSAIVHRYYCIINRLRKYSWFKNDTQMSPAWPCIHWGISDSGLCRRTSVNWPFHFIQVWSVVALWLSGLSTHATFCGGRLTSAVSKY